MATLRPALGHARERSDTRPPARTRPWTWLRSGILLSATTALTVTLLPGVAAAEPGRATSPEQAAQLVAEASDRLEAVQEQVNTAREELKRQQAAADGARRAADRAAEQLQSLDGQIRQLARSAYTTGGNQLAGLDVMLTSGSAEEFVAQLGTLDAIGRYTAGSLDEVSQAAEAADAAREQADRAEADAQQSLDDIQAQQAGLQTQIADYQRQYDALTAAQQTQVARATSGEALAAPAAGSVVAPSAAAQVAVDTALAQVGDPYVWGAAGPDAFDCSGLTMYAYAAAGVTLPHSSKMQATMGVPVSPSDLQPGDLVFFYNPISHEGMYIGNGQMVHASTSGQPVKVIDISAMMGDFTTARRVAG